MTVYSHAAWIAGLGPRWRIVAGDEAALAAIRGETRNYYGASDITEDAPVFVFCGLFVKGLGQTQYQVPDSALKRYIHRPPYPADPIARMPVAARPVAPLPAPAETPIAEPPAVATIDEPVLPEPDVIVDQDDIVEEPVNDQRSASDDTAGPNQPDAVQDSDVLDLEMGQRIETSTAPTRREELIAASFPVQGEPDGIVEMFNRTRLYHEIDPQTFPFHGEARWFVNHELATGIHIIGDGDNPPVFQVPMNRIADMVTARAAPSLPWIDSPIPLR